MQGQINIGVYADAKLLFIGDDYGNDAGTIDVVILTKLYNGGYGGWSRNILVYPVFEYAKLSGGKYMRYAMGVGYKFGNKLNIEPSIDYGRVVRWGWAYSSFNGLLCVSYGISNKIQISVLNSLTQRNDLKFRWGDDVWRYNFYFGLTYDVH